MSAASEKGAGHDIVVIGASAGGVAAVKTVVAGLPPSFPGSVFVVIHTAPDSPGMVPQILDRIGTLPARFPRDGEEIQPRQIYVAPPDWHMLIRPGHVHLSRGPRENATRPAVNPLFRSAARSYGPRVVGVILTGALDDGSAGLIAVEESGGVTIVQDPADAEVPGMPENALTYVDADHVLPLVEIAPRLIDLARQPPSGDISMATRKAAIEDTVLEENRASGYACPECHGALWAVTEGPILEYRCRTGHMYSPDTLMHHLTERSIEELESTHRALSEEAAMAESMVARARERQLDKKKIERLNGRAIAARARADLVLDAMRLPADDLEAV
jgi:two-component system, chemotaxis family, protein-glutamate methylesterase/glutaminase